MARRRYRYRNHVTTEGYPHRTHWVTPMVALGGLLTLLCVCCGAYLAVLLKLV